MDRSIGTVKRGDSAREKTSEFVHFWAAWAIASVVSVVVFLADLEWYWTTVASAVSLALSWIVFRWGNRNSTMTEIPIVERRYRSGRRYRLGCQAIRILGRLTGVEIDFQPLALPGDRLTSYVNCPHCGKACLVTVSLYNETTCQCRHCQKPFETMNSGASIWVLMSDNGPPDLREIGLRRFADAKIRRTDHRNQETPRCHI